MMRNTLAARLFLLLALSGGFDASAVTHAAGPPPAIALLSEGHGLLEWIPLAQYESITLALADPQGVVRTFQFGPGTAPVLSLFDAQGVPLPDGTYTWELRAATLVQSGHFSMSKGRLVASEQTERPERRSRKGLPGVTTAPDQVVPDDLIIDGKGCIGLGCSNNEAFGPETLRLKQSVVRLRFEDTSAQAGFPARDWQLTVNDVGSGGADRFSIEDLTAGTTPLTMRGGAPNNSLYVDASGRLGLGTATPAERLHVLENVDANTIITSENPNPGLNALGALRAKSDSAIVNFQAHGSGRTLSRFGQPLASWAEFLQVNGNGLIIGTLADKPLLLGTNNISRIHIDPTGKIGIGTASPQAQLHVSLGEVRFPPGSPGVGFTHFNYPFDGKNYIRGATVIADHGGNVGIGTASPSSKLHVSGGDIRLSGGSFIDDGVTLNAPDYVFDPDYPLMPLAELKAYVVREKHLPNVPNARDIRQQGLDLSQFQMRLLEKVEELTLYAVEQHEGVAALKEENSQLQARLEALERSSTSTGKED